MLRSAAISGLYRRPERWRKGFWRYIVEECQSIWSSYCR
jgi:hypothetical protein